MVIVEIDNTGNSSAAYFIPAGGKGSCGIATSQRTNSNGTINQVDFPSTERNPYEAGAGSNRFWTVTAYNASGSGAALAKVTVTTYNPAGAIVQRSTNGFDTSLHQ